MCSASVQLDRLLEQQVHFAPSELAVVPAILASTPTRRSETGW